MIRLRDSCDVGFREFLLRAADHRTDLPRVDKQRLAFTVAVASLLVRFLRLGQEPQANGNLRRVKQLTRQRDHAIDHVVLHQLLTIAPSPVVLVLIEPLANTKPATPWADSFDTMCRIQA